MRKYFYLVEFKRFIKKLNYEACLDLGIFSTKNNASKKIMMSKDLNGFRNYSIDNFQVTKFGVDFDIELLNKTEVILYCVLHEYEDENEQFTNWCVFDYCDTLKRAQNKIDYLKKHSRIGKKHPNNFDIIEIKVDNFNSWSEGFDELNKN